MGVLDIIFGVLGVGALIAVFWLAASYLKAAQAEDRRYGGSSDSGAGVTGIGDPGPAEQPRRRKFLDM